MPISRSDITLKQTAGLVLLLLSSASAADALYSRNLSCEQQSSSRTQEICRALEQALEWTWTGHAILSPSYRVGTQRIRQIYCTLPIMAKDTESLVDMALRSASQSGMVQLQINIGVRSLLLLLGNQALDHFPALDAILDEGRRRSARGLQEYISLTIAEGSSSIFSPSHAYYILGDGC